MLNMRKTKGILPKVRHVQDMFKDIIIKRRNSRSDKVELVVNIFKEFLYVNDRSNCRYANKD
ncbi:MAG: hypothetical protein A4E66_02495 [Syntrophus sp. PtaB.Bin001]|nr:MAG: hypothetical protein A4E66_02495 [Syntrophus sp. PtaB.Bin001]